MRSEFVSRSIQQLVSGYIMKTRLITYLGIIFCSPLFGQNQCGCKEMPELKQFFLCDTTTFQNKSKIYYKYNCDSSWLTFETDKHQKRIMYSLEKDLISLTFRLGYQFEKEYSNLLLFQNRQASGGGFPINYALINKENGEVFSDLGPILYYSENYPAEFIVSLREDTVQKKYSLDFYFLKTNKDYYYTNIEKSDQISINDSQPLYGENLFKDAKIIGDTFKIVYNYHKISEPDKIYKDTIMIDLKKYNR